MNQASSIIESGRLHPEIIDGDPVASDDPHAAFHASHYSDGQFRMPWGDFEKKPASDLLKWKLAGSDYKALKRKEPELDLADNPLDQWRAQPGDLKVMWLGHATFFIELDGIRILIDPLFGHVNPVVRRHAPLALDPHNLPAIDLVLLTHGHYDHLNAPSLKMCAETWPQSLFCVPRGQAPYLPKNCQGRTISLDWWQHFYLEHVKLTFLPSQHWHQRSLRDYNTALWGGWWLEGSHSIYHMGDSGYFDGFKAIFARMQAPDVMMLPMGAYEPRWFMSTQHMDPQQALSAWEDLGARYAIPMHYGVFDLSDEPIDYGPKEFREHAMTEATHTFGLDEQFLQLAQGGSASFSNKQRQG